MCSRNPASPHSSPAIAQSAIAPPTPPSQSAVASPSLSPPHADKFQKHELLVSQSSNSLKKKVRFICHDRRMTILLGHTTALSYWRSLGAIASAHDHRCLLGSSIDRRNATAHLQLQLSSSKSRRDSIDYILHYQSSHVILTGKQLRSRRQLETCHTYKRLPPYSCQHTNVYFRQEPLFASTPEFCFLQMARELPFPQLIALGFELCGTYAACGDLTYYNVFPLTTPEKLQTFLTRASGFKGVKQARRALRYILPASASPMETNLAMLLSLPYALGGYGLEQPQMNHRIEIPKTLKRRSSSQYFKCDLYWKSANLAIEYDSDLAHAGINSTVRDALRRSTLSSIGISVVSVTKPQIMNSGAFNQLAHLIALKMKKRLQYVDPQFTQRHLALRDLLLFDCENPQQNRA